MQVGRPPGAICKLEAPAEDWWECDVAVPDDPGEPAERPADAEAAATAPGPPLPPVAGHGCAAIRSSASACASEVLDHRAAILGRVAAAVVLVATAYVLWLVFGICRGWGLAWYRWGVYCASVVILILITPSTAWLLCRAPTTHLRCVAWFGASAWAAQALMTMSEATPCTDGRRNMLWLFHGTEIILSNVTPIFFCALVLRRLKALGAYAQQKQLSVKIFEGATWVTAGLVLVRTVAMFEGFLSGNGGSLAANTQGGAVLCWLVWLQVFLYHVCCVMALGIFLRARHVTLQLCRWAPPCWKAEARRSARALLEQIVAVAFGMVTSGLMLISRSYYRGANRVLGLESAEMWSQGGHAIIKAPWLLDNAANAFAAVAFSGAFSGAIQAKASANAKVRRRQKCRAHFAADLRHAWRSRRRNDLDAAWQDAVYELAGRGFTLEALLQFYAGLGSKYMLHYEASKHTTTDVVRQALIPLSRDACSAYASVVMRGQYTRPKKMVTHNWSNLFRDLVAAIVADALDESEYAMVAHLLEHDMGTLEQWVRAAGAHLRTYWVCALSVNQHRSICGANLRGSKDPTTGELHASCECRLRKAWNGTAPTLPSGRSIPCEMNKFDDMMKFLAATDPDFEQVIAVDASFELFTRAWCISEIAAAHTAGVAQRLKFDQADTLHRHEARLHAIKIEDMEASRPEDKEEILAGIPDVDAFNSHLQHLLFRELLPDWRTLDASEQMRRVGRMLRWQQVCKGWDQEVLRRSFAAGQECNVPAL